MRTTEKTVQGFRIFTTFNGKKQYIVDQSTRAMDNRYIVHVSDNEEKAKPFAHADECTTYIGKIFNPHEKKFEFEPCTRPALAFIPGPTYSRVKNHLS
jgi:hypothetical protein